MMLRLKQFRCDETANICMCSQRWNRWDTTGKCRLQQKLRGRYDKALRRVSRTRARIGGKELLPHEPALPDLEGKLSTHSSDPDIAASTDRVAERRLLVLQLIENIYCYKDFNKTPERRHNIITGRLNMIGQDLHMPARMKCRWCILNSATST